MTHDKKNEAGTINFTLLGGIGDIRINQAATEAEICEALDFYREGNPQAKGKTGKKRAEKLNPKAQKRNAKSGGTRNAQPPTRGTPWCFDFIIKWNHQIIFSRS